ncbi:MAG: aminopeptidase P N-terminal domain-containing protein [Lentimicrobiaceae bacterium]|nr:aminopeptidase P N-terminal domain-containing protein [Lentimicrobiaceae bacterium]
MTTSEQFSTNRQRLVPLLEDNALVLLVSNDEMPRTGDQNFPFRQNSNFFYLTGINQPKSIAALCPHHPNPAMRAVLFIEEGNEKTAMRDGRKLSKEQARALSGIETVFWLSQFDRTLQELAYYAQAVYLDIQEHTHYATDVERQELRFAKKIKQQYPLHRFCRLHPLLISLRLVKSAWELEQIRRACAITVKAFERVQAFVKSDVKECEIEAEITHEFIRNGAVCAFRPIVASGKNACVLHYSANNAVCKDGDLLLLDFGAEYANYAADMSRTIAVNGAFSPRQKQVYDACLRVFEYGKTLYKPGMSIFKVQKKVCEMMEKELLALGLFSEEDLQKETEKGSLMKKYFMHKVSHFVGLDVHDVGNNDILFEQGMVLTCEPGIYIPEESIGIRIETMLLITENGAVDLIINH